MNHLIQEELIEKQAQALRHYEDFNNSLRTSLENQEKLADLLKAANEAQAEMIENLKMILDLKESEFKNLKSFSSGQQKTIELLFEKSRSFENKLIELKVDPGQVWSGYGEMNENL